IGVSTAKGLCYGLDIPLISISTLEIMTIEAQNRIQYAEDALFIPMIDARRMEVYDAIFDAQRNRIRQVAANIINENSYNEAINKHTTYFFGSGSAKCQHLVSSENAVFLEDIHPLAENMIEPAVHKYQVKDFVDIAYFEPFYLKEFHTTIPKKIR
ncbi:MAG: tRNA (adenosine(37)-N6)-threonylcarbamoyltransferase complex dimerization subunit type 1 TsaB, partial [Paludibacter sp.]|nr:tRNA (adenosine(37)-N6)-threonylcarbamoyltransferase complex dimerization subunit type 1 TsaB [Paludibacter sp.]